MKKIFLLILFVLPMTLLVHNSNANSDPDLNPIKSIKTVSSPHNRVAMLELYTSEGCSSCPPADRFLSGLKASGISDKQLIPMAFHVTYWDYIGWKDRFANIRFDKRQSELVHKKNKSTVYTPQFVLSGEDYRSYATFSEDVNRIVAQESMLDLELSAEVLPDNESADNLVLSLKVDMSLSKLDQVGLYLVIIENNLVSDVDDGENDGEILHHDYVVREILGPYYQSKSDDQLIHQQKIRLQSEWKRKDLSIVAFAENPRTAEVLQAVRLEY